MAKFKVLNPKCRPEKDLKTGIQFYHKGKPVVFGQVIEIDLSENEGIATAADLTIRNLAEPADKEAEKFFKRHISTE